MFYEPSKPGYILNETLFHIYYVFYMFCVLRTCISDRETVFHVLKTIFRKIFKNSLQVLYAQIFDCL